MIKFTGPEDRTTKATKKVTDKERLVLKMLSEDPGYTIPQLSERLGISRKTVVGYIKRPKENGVIERSAPIEKNIRQYIAGGLKRVFAGTTV